MKLNFFQFVYTIVLVSALVLILGGTFTSNSDASTAGAYLGFCLFWVATLRFLTLGGYS
jgi:hypothetical protein